jgi:hypothetical protein
LRFKSKVLAAGATLALAATAALATAGAGATWAATPSCGDGNHCVDVFSREFGTHANPLYVLDVFRGGAKVGQPIILFRGSSADKAEDFTYAYQGTTSDFYAAGLVSAAVELHYGGSLYLQNNVPGAGLDEPAFELEYAPYGVDSGLCVGVARTAFQHEGVTLQPCGISAKTVWILDTFDRSFPAFNHGYIPVINGSDTNFSHPFVLHYPDNGFPTDKPRPQLNVTNLTGFSNGFGPIVGTVPDNQLWGADFGVLK